MDESRRFFHYNLKWTADRKFQVCKGSSWFSKLFILCGNGEPRFPNHPITKHEFYALLSNPAARGFMDNLLDFQNRSATPLNYANPI
jgi:hypothetical protein